MHNINLKIFGKLENLVVLKKKVGIVIFNSTILI